MADLYLKCQILFSIDILGKIKNKRNLSHLMLSRILEYLKLRRMGYIHRQSLRSLIRKVIRDNTGYSFFEGKNSEYCKNSSLVWKESYSEERSASKNKDTMWFDLHSSTLRCTTSLCAVYKSDPLNIIDIGGGRGSVYHESKKFVLI